MTPGSRLAGLLPGANPARSSTPPELERPLLQTSSRRSSLEDYERADYLRGSSRRDYDVTRSNSGGGSGGSARALLSANFALPNSPRAARSSSPISNRLSSEFDAHTAYRLSQDLKDGGSNFVAEGGAVVGEAPISSSHSHILAVSRGKVTRRCRALLLLILLSVTSFVIFCFLVRGPPDVRWKLEPYVPEPLPIEPLVEPFPPTKLPLKLEQVWPDLADRFGAAKGDHDLGLIPCNYQIGDSKQGNEIRYAHLRQDRGRTLVALNLYNSAEVLPSLARELIRLIDFLGRDKIHVSLFENGSEDSTPELEAHFAAALTAMKVDHTFVRDSVKADRRNVDRIQQLAIYRNIALAPLWREGGDEFETVLFINDVYGCMMEPLELLHQRKKQNAHATCGLDYTGKKGNPQFYDNWVTRSLTGNTLYPRFDMWRAFKPRKFLDDIFREKGEERYRQRFLERLPVPVYSCWNGMIALDARPFRGQSPVAAPSSLALPSTSSLDEQNQFSPNKLFVDRELKEHDMSSISRTDADEGVRFRGADWESGECTASECTLVAKDFWKRGFKRFVLVPTVHLVYDPKLWNDPKLQEMARASYRRAPEDELIDWDQESEPQKVVCWGWTTSWHIDWAWLRAKWEMPY